MRKEHEEAFDPAKPALKVLCGATRRKFRLLEGDVIILGRSSGCNIGLVSPEVAPVHCIIVRVNGTWRIRDCSGRGTRVNGVAIHDEPLRNGDTIQVGTFSFEAHLPPGSAGTPPPPTKSSGPTTEEVARLQESRRRLGELALSLRKRLRDQDAEKIDLGRQQADLEKLEHRLRQAHQENQNRLNEMAKRSAELDGFARHLKKEAEKLREEAGAQGRAAAEEQASYEADLVRQRVEQNQEAERLSQWQCDLKTRQQDLEALAEEHSKEREQIAHEREQIAREREQIAREREYLNDERQQLVEERARLDRLEAERANQVAPSPSSRETQLDTSPSGRVESARKLLRELNERRKQAEHSDKQSSVRSPRILQSRTHSPEA